MCKKLLLWLLLRHELYALGPCLCPFTPFCHWSGSHWLSGSVKAARNMSKTNSTRARCPRIHPAPYRAWETKNGSWDGSWNCVMWCCKLRCLRTWRCGDTRPGERVHLAECGQEGFQVLLTNAGRQVTLLLPFADCCGQERQERGHISSTTCMVHAGFFGRLQRHLHRRLLHSRSVP